MTAPLRTGDRNSAGHTLTPVAKKAGQKPEAAAPRRWMASDTPGTVDLDGFDAAGTPANEVVETGRQELTRVAIRNTEIARMWLNNGEERDYYGEPRAGYPAERAERDVLEARMRELDADWDQGLDLLAKYRAVRKLVQTPAVAERGAALRAAVIAVEATRNKAFKKGAEPRSAPTTDYSVLLTTMEDDVAADRAVEEKNLNAAIDECESVLGYLESDRPQVARDHGGSIRELAALGRALAAGELVTEEDFVALGSIDEACRSTAAALLDEYDERGAADDLLRHLSVISRQVEDRCAELNF